MAKTGLKDFWRQRTSFRFLFVLTVILAMLAIAIAGTFVVQNQARLEGRHELRAVIALAALERSLLDAETGQRGYLLTGRKDYLVPFAEAQGRLAAARRDVDQYVGHDRYGRKVRDLRSLHQLIDQKMEELKETVGLRAKGERNRAIEIVATNIGKRSMDNIRYRIEALTEGARQRQNAALNRFDSWRNLLAPLFVILIFSIVLLMFFGLRTQRQVVVIEAEAAQASALREANRRADLLTRELNHRVKNLFSVVLAIITLSARRRPQYDDMAEDLTSRIHALSLAHSVSQGTEVTQEVPLRDVFARTLEPYADLADGKVMLDGPDIFLPVGKVTPIGLITHELATNAAKYGALSWEEGRVSIRWDWGVGDDGAHVILEWVETGGPPVSSQDGAAEKAGFGSTMLDLCVKQLHGQMERAWPASGAVVRIVWPQE